MSAAGTVRFPNNALFHAEATLLLRVAAENGDTLAGRTLNVRVSREMCQSCKQVLPLLGLELGNPTVSFIEPSGKMRTMRDGSWVGQDPTARKFACFNGVDYPRWPEPDEIKDYFIAPPGRQWFSGVSKTDTAGLWANGVDGTEHLNAEEGRVHVDLKMWGHPNLGVLFIYWKRAGILGEAYASLGDMSRIEEMVALSDRDILPIGLFVPFEEAWEAVKEFVETGGNLPRSIDWIPSGGWPPNIFPEPTRENAERYGLAG